MQTAIEYYHDLETDKDKTAYYNACVNKMDDELRERLHADIADKCTESGFLHVYSLMHKDKFNEDFVVN